MVNAKKVIENVKIWVREVGKIQLNSLDKSDLTINRKSSKIDLVTEIDEISEKYLIQEIKKYYPNHSILSEEAGEDDVESDYLWIIDPLDGTTNYAQGLPIFTISVALQYKGETILGVVYAPKVNEFFEAVKGDGAYLNNEKIKVSEKSDLKECVLATGFPYDRATNNDNNVNYFTNIIPKVRGIRRMGSAAYDLVTVASGRFDGYWELNLSLWDVAAGILILEEAEGIVEYIPNKREISLVAGNKALTKRIMDEIKSINTGL